MKVTDQTLMEQLRITPREIRRRKEYFEFTEDDAKKLEALRPVIADNIDGIVKEFYERIISFDEMARVIGDAESLRRLKNHQRNYVLTLFDGQYDEEYVHARLRVGLVHRRIGVSPKYYLSAVDNLSSALRQFLSAASEKDCPSCVSGMDAVSKVLMFDLTLIFDTYIGSLIQEAERSKEELEEYAQSLETEIAKRTEMRRDQARHDGLTDLLNQHSFYDELKRELSRGQRRGHCTSLIYFDLDGFKQMNDTKGHKRGDEILVAVSEAMQSVVREADLTARYGGDEFCIILPETTLEQAGEVASRLHEAIRASVDESAITCSTGIAISTPEKLMTADLLVRAADTAMYEAKKVPGFALRMAT